MNVFNYSTTLTRCMLASALALALGVAFPAIPPVVAFMAALTPLIWYHTMFLRPHAAEGLPQPAIDSVYYYGFLITIGALGATTLDLALHGIGADFAPVAFQFGLGLLATGYAVWARVHLTASSRVLDEEELRALMNRQIAQSRELLANIEIASSSFENYATTLLQRSEQFAVDAEARSRTSMDAAIKAFSDGIAAMSEQAQIALSDLRGVVNDVTFGAEREALRNSVSSMVETVTQLSEGLDRLRASSSAGAGSVGDFAGSLERVNVAAAAAGARLEPLGREDGTIARFGEALDVGIQRTWKLASSVDGAATSITAFGEAGAAGRQAMDLIGRKATHTAGKMDVLGDALETIGGHGENVGHATGQLTELTSAARDATTRLSELGGQVTSLRSGAFNLDAALHDTTTRLKASADEGVQNIEKAVQRFSLDLDEIHARAAARIDDGSQGNGMTDARSAI